MKIKNEKCDLVVWGGTALTMDNEMRVIENAIISIAAGKIQSIESKKNYQPPSGAKTLDATGCIVMPGLVNGHTHVGMTLLRGIADDLPLYEWLHHHIFPIERKMGKKDFVALGTQLACLEMIRSGTTTFNDMYYFEEAAAEAAHEMGIRAICGQTHIEISGVEKPGEVFEKFDKFFKKLEKFPIIVGALAPHSIYGLSEKLWKEMISYAHKNDLIIHTHLAETKKECEEVRKSRGMSPVEWFDSIGLWEQKAICAHAVELSEKDISILGKNKVGIIYNPDSNLKLGNGICPVVSLRSQGARVGFGTDSTASNNNLDMLQEVDVGTKLQTLKYGVGKLTARESVKMLTIEGAKAIHMDNLIGSIEVGKAADIIAIDVTRPHSIPLYDPYSHLVYSASGSDVLHSIVDGKILMKNRKLTGCDENEILKKSKTWGKKIFHFNAKLQDS